MKRHTVLATAAAILSLAACSGEAITGLDQMLYNATYTGAATFENPLPNSNVPDSPPPRRITMTLSQLGQNFTGTFQLTDSTGQRIYGGSVTGKANNTGADFSLVIPEPCPGALYGSLTVSQGELTGSATGRDCSDAASGTDVRITFTNLVRQ